MKKVSTEAAKQSRNFSQPKLDDWVGPGRSLQLVLPAGRSGRVVLEQKVSTTPAS